jgi:hypothetical protein
MNNVQHQEDTKYKQWQDGMYVMLDDLKCAYEAGLVENSLRDSVYYTINDFFDVAKPDNCLGVLVKESGLWRYAERLPLKTKLTRAQALYIATGDTNI